MKKILIFGLVVMAFAFSFPYTAKGYSYLPKGIEDGYIYSTKEGGDLLLEVGDKKIYQRQANIMEMYKGFADDNVVGVTGVVRGDEDMVNAYIKKFGVKVIGTQKILEKKIIYAYSKYLSGYTLAKDRETNIQIVIEKDTITVGIPIIIGSF